MKNINTCKKQIAEASLSIMEILEEMEALETVQSSDMLSDYQKECIEQYELFMKSDELFTMSETAKLLSFGRNRTFKILREKEILLEDILKKNKVLLLHNDPSQYAINQGYFKVVQRTGLRNEFGEIIKCDVTYKQSVYGKKRVLVNKKTKVIQKKFRTQTLVTPKGLDYIKKILDKELNIKK